MESRLPHARRAVRTHRNVLWPNKLAGNIPDDDEYHIPTTSDAGMVLYIHGRWCHSH